MKVWKGSSKFNPVLELFYYRGEWQLGTEDALYSTGTRYRPLIKGLRSIQQYLGQKENALVLGAGLGSGLSILAKMGYYPKFTLVDIDAVVIDLANTLMDERIQFQGTFILADAEAFVAACKEKYDLLIVDVFNSRQVPEFISQTSFLMHCNALLCPNGHIITNYMIDSSVAWEDFLTNFTEVFQHVEVINLGLNRILVAQFSSLDS